MAGPLLQGQPSQLAQPQVRPTCSRCHCDCLVLMRWPRNRMHTSEACRAEWGMQGAEAGAVGHEPGCAPGTGKDAHLPGVQPFRQ